MKIPIEVTARHIHINDKDFKFLFGKSEKLKVLSNLSQVKFYACKQTLDIKTERGRINKVRIVGPERNYTQIEISKTDAYKLGIKPPIRESGNLRGTPGVLLIGTKGKLKLKKGVILPRRHIHLNPKEARKLKVKYGQTVSVETKKGLKCLIFKNVFIRVHEDYKLSMHIDIDEGNAAGIDKVGYGRIL